MVFALNAATLQGIFMLKRFTPQDLDGDFSLTPAIALDGRACPAILQAAPPAGMFGLDIVMAARNHVARDLAGTTAATRTSDTFSFSSAGPKLLIVPAANARLIAANVRDIGNGSRGLSLAVKHGFDRVLAVLALMILAPLVLLIALAIKLEDAGPVFFRQTRVGVGGKTFSMWKFRSMVIDAEAQLAALRAQSERDDTCFKMKRDPRVTRVGSLLRRLSLDELPQLLNVLFGQMSLVGPRPALPREVQSYTPAARERLAGRPGLTCTWQVTGRADLPFEKQVELDITYLRTRSLMTDFVLMLRTIPAVLTARGAY